MSLPRFYLPQLSTTGMGCLDAAESRHAHSVLRLKAGECLVLFDGCGQEGLGKITAASKSKMEFEVLECKEVDHELPHALTLAVALPKGDRQKTLVDAATELGVTELVPLRSERSVAQPTEQAIERHRRQVVEACKQSGRNRLMRIVEPHSIQELCAASQWPDAVRLVAHPYDDAMPRKSIATVLNGPRRPVMIAIGPEGGWTTEELQFLVDQGWQSVDLGRTILRVEVATIAAIAQIAAWINQIDPVTT